MSAVPGFAIEGLVLDVDGVLTDASLYYAEAAEVMKVVSARDGMGMALLRDAGIPMAVVSGRASPMVTARLEELGVSTIEFRRMDKAAAFGRICEDWGLDPARVAAMGDDIVDVPMLRRAGFAAAPADADPRVRGVADHVCAAAGGRGAVRELCEIILASRGAWAAIEERFELGEGS
jgi:3-deoxy-D-manno-octulosonate 8-phosphate phosphatase (KDO 8-P phosphatase)